MARLDELWRETGGPGLPPRPDSGRIKARVNAALDASSTERKLYMKQKWRVALAAVAALAAITGTAFAAAANWDMLTAWFRGDTTPGQTYVDSQVRSVSDENYTLTVESSAADERSVYLTVRITALSDEARAFIRTEEFGSIDTFSVRALSDAGGSEEDAGAPAAPGPAEGPVEGPAEGPAAGPAEGPTAEAPAMAASFSYRSLECADEDSLRYALAVNTLPTSVHTLRVRCGYMEKGKAVDVPVAPAASLTVEINASGEGVLDTTPAEAVDSFALTIREITLSPFTCAVYGSSSAGSDIYPNIRFRMKDGSELTQSQMLNSIGASFNGYTGQCEYNYRFKEVQDLDSIAALIVFDRAYPLDGSKSVPVEHDPALDPFTVPRMEPLSATGGYTVPVQALTEGLGGTYTWDAASRTAACTYRGVTITLKAGDIAALVDGQAVEQNEAPAEQDGILAADCMVFEDAWGISCQVQSERDRSLPEDQYELIWHDWYIIP